MANLNKWIGIGIVGRPPETRYISDGLAVTNFSIAVTEKYKDKQGSQKETTDWVNVATFGKLAEIVEKYVTKGALLFVEGKLKIEKYKDKQGIDKVSPKIIAEAVHILTSKKQAEDIEENIGNKGKTPAMLDTCNSDEFLDDLPF